jgi:hypothetical protein
MRMLSLVFVLSILPALASAQPPLANRPDSGGVALAIARAIREPIQKNGAPRAAPVTGKSIQPASVLWNAKLLNALRAVDTNLVSRKPTKETLLFNIVSMSMTRDSASANVAMSRCYADRFVGSSAVYELKRNGAEWKIVGEQRGIAARGKCPK